MKISVSTDLFIIHIIMQPSKKIIFLWCNFFHFSFCSFLGTCSSPKTSDGLFFYNKTGNTLHWLELIFCVYQWLVYRITGNSNKWYRVTDQGRITIINIMYPPTMALIWSDPYLYMTFIGNCPCLCKFLHVSIRLMTS